MLNSLVLGTVNFGMPYGVEPYQVPGMEINNILDITNMLNLTLDTAQAYGTAEKIIGNYQYNSNIITKLKPYCKADEIPYLIQESLRTLKVNSLYGLLLHTETQIRDLNILHALVQAKKEGWVKNIGVSVYDMHLAMDAAEMNFDFIQVPYSVFDQVLDSVGFFYTAHKNNIKIFTRSAFLQGILTNYEEDNLYYARIDTKWPFFNKKFKKFEKIVKKYGYSKSEACLLFNFTNPLIDHIVIGVDNHKQLKANVKLLQNEEKIHGFKECREELVDAFYALNYQIPSLWSRKEK